LDQKESIVRGLEMPLLISAVQPEKPVIIGLQQMSGLKRKYTDDSQDTLPSQRLKGNIEVKHREKVLEKFQKIIKDN